MCPRWFRTDIFELAHGYIQRQPAPYFLRPDELYANLPVPADGRCIRVLDLDPLPKKKAKDRSPLTGRLRVVRLADSPDFAALSYVWGGYSASPDYLTIHVNDGPAGQYTDLAITANCRDALRALRRKYGGVSIWVDAICINQRDDQEKSWQITLMEEIYSWAAPVIVWLGRGTTRSNRALTWLSRASHRGLFLDLVDFASTEGVLDRVHIKMKLARSFMGVVVERLWERQVSYIYLFHGIGGWLGGKGFYASFSRLNQSFHQKDLANITDRDWFQRAWTFQEIMLATDIVLLCGSTDLKWDRVVRGLQLCPENPSFVTPSNDTLADLVNVWMNVERPEQWNGNSPRRNTEEGRSAGAYQREAKRMISSRLLWILFLPSAFWMGSFVSTFVNVFLVVFVIGLGPAIVQHTMAYFVYIGAILSLVVSILVGIIDTAHEFVLFRWAESPRRREMPKTINFGVEITRDSEDQRQSGDIFLDGVIKAIRERKSTNPRDRSYALYGVFRNLGIGSSAPDYTKPVGQVYQELFTSLIRWRPRLLSLMMDVNDDPLRGAPTWVPNWSTAAEKNWIGSDYLYTRARSVAPNSAETFVVLRGDEMMVRGMWRGSVNWASGPLQRIDLSSIRGTQLLFSAELMAGALSLALWISYTVQNAPNINAYLQLYQAVAAVITAAAAPPTTTTGEEKTGALNLSGSSFDNWYRVMSTVKPAALGGVGSNASPQRREEEFRSHFLAQPQYGDVLRLTAQICNHLAGTRNLFTTSEGYAGSGPEGMRGGDVIAWIIGVPVPMVLRRWKSYPTRYTVVGPAFIHGLMEVHKELTIPDCPEIILV